MKAILAAALLVIIIGNIEAVDTESYRFIDHLRSLSKAEMPKIIEDAVLFTAPSTNRRVGISFAHESYAKVHWLRQLFIPRDGTELFFNGKPIKGIDPNIDSGILFHLETIPRDAKNLDYRMIIDGLWTIDPLNPISVTGSLGVAESRIPLPAKAGIALDTTPPGTYRFSYRADSGETVTVGGSFNNWDPFMYEMREISPGFYTMLLPLPPGRFQYAFFYRGEQIPDPENIAKLYTREGRIISEGVIP